uniref:Uncharacterized protein n=1 Tax=Vitis vinifera TaxID=29760 RepID=A5AKH5_VITVI|nr:hypothetical protein VITISV_042002 [Vitis vinifera]
MAWMQSHGNFSHPEVISYELLEGEVFNSKFCINPLEPISMAIERHHWVHASRDLLYLLHFIHEGMGFDHRVFELSFPSFLSPYHPSLHYVPCLKTTLRPWDQISSSTASMWTDAILGHIPFRRIFMDLRREPSSVLRSTFRVAFSVSAFRVVITSQLRCSEPSSLLLSVSAFRAVTGFQIDVQSRVLGFGVQSRYHFSASVFRAIITTSLSFGVQSRHRFSDRRSESRSRFRRSELLSLLSFGSHHHYFSQFRRSEPSSVFRSTFRVAFSVSAFRVVITSQLRRSEPSSLLLLVSTFRAIIGFKIDVQSRVLGFSIQSRYHFSASVFRAIITTSLSFGVQSYHRFSDRHSESHPRFRRSESLSLLSLTFRVIIITSLSFGVQSHHRFSDRHSESPPRFRRSKSLSLLSLTFRVIIITSQFRHSEPSSIFRSTFRVASSVSAFRVVITSQFDVQSHHHHFSVSAFKAIIDFQIDIQSRILGFGVQSRYHFSV